MSINVKAKQAKLQVGEGKGSYRFILQSVMYNTLSAAKVIRTASEKSGINRGVLQAAWAAIGDVICDWATEGHSVAVPGLGHMRFGLRATSVEKVSDVSSKLITSRRVIFTPSVGIKQELANTGISITCYDKDGKVIKTVVSTDTDDIEEDTGSTDTPSGSGDGSGNTGGSGNEGAGGDDFV